MGILALIVAAVMFFFSAPIWGIGMSIPGLGIPGGVLAIILGVIGMSVGRYRVAGAFGFLFGLATLTLKLTGINRY